MQGLKMDVNECICLILTGRYFLTSKTIQNKHFFPICYGSTLSLSLSSTLTLYISHSFSTLPQMPSHCSQEFHSRASGLNLALDIDSLGHIQMCKNIKLNISIVGSILAIMNLHFTSSEPLLTPFHICISQCNKISMGCVACFSNSNDADKRTYSLYIGNCISIKFLLWKTCGLLKEIAHPK